MYVPEPVALQQLYAQRKQTDSNTPFPYWAKLWPSAIALASFIHLHPVFVMNKNVLELAAGIGLPSLVASSFATHVCCSDKDEEAVAVAEKNASLNHITNMSFACYDWSHLPSAIKADTLLLSDVNYDPESFPTLMQIITHFLERKTTILLATPQRLMAKPFIASLLKRAVAQHTLEIMLEGEQHVISVLVLQ